MPLTVYLSSTLTDLESEREAIKAALADECMAALASPVREPWSS